MSYPCNFKTFDLRGIWWIPAMSKRVTVGRVVRSRVFGNRIWCNAMIFTCDESNAGVTKGEIHYLEANRLATLSPLRLTIVLPGCNHRQNHGWQRVKPIMHSPSVSVVGSLMSIH